MKLKEWPHNFKILKNKKIPSIPLPVLLSTSLLDIMTEDQQEERSSENPQPPMKKLRSQQPDVVVVVGSGEWGNKQEFECYKLLLCYHCEYLDTMLSHQTKENETSRIELPDKDPEKWKVFHEFIDPPTIATVKVTNENATMMTDGALVP